MLAEQPSKPICSLFVRLRLFDVFLCAASVSVSVSVDSVALQRPDEVRTIRDRAWDRQALWAKAASVAQTDPGSVDGDRDGIDDASELALAKAYFPYYSVDPRDECARHGVVFRLTPHPEDTSKIAIWYVVLYERDCGRLGIGGHVGDDESFSELIDPSTPPPTGVLALRAISHQNTLLERETNCGALPGRTPCETARIEGKRYPVVFSSSNKHGQYVNWLDCVTWPNDLGACSVSKNPDEPPFVNAGEPGRNLCNDLTLGGFIHPGNGWSEPTLMHFDPWSSQKFGRAGCIGEDLIDQAFLISSR
jgi:hypothetical protein